MNILVMIGQLGRIRRNELTLLALQPVMLHSDVLSKVGDPVRLETTLITHIFSALMLRLDVII